MTVDGGTNRWLSWLNKNNISCCKNPDLITGDMDSITEETYEYFSSRSVQIINTPDQNETDYTKALMQLKKHIIENHIEV